MQFNIHEAKTQFSKLVAAVERGETVTICRNGRPVIECVPSRLAVAFPFGAWERGGGDLSRLAEPTDEATLDEMGL